MFNKKVLVEKNIIMVLILCVIFLTISFFKVSRIKNRPHHNYREENCFFWSESALHYKYAKMVAEGKNIAEVDYTIQSPTGVKPFVAFTLLSEIVIGKTYRLINFFADLPFQTFLIYFIGFFSSIPLFAVYFLADEIWKNRIVAMACTLFYTFVMASSNRTASGGFLHEDFALPFIFGSLYFFIKAQNSQKVIYSIMSGLTLFIALGAWHLTRFYLWLLVPLIVLMVLFLQREERFWSKNLGIVVVFSVLSGVTFPCVRARSFLFSCPMVAMYMLLLLCWSRRHKNLGKGRELSILLITLGISILLMNYLSHGELKEFSHVFKIVLAKMRYLGQKPCNPGLLPFEVRVMWESSFLSPTLQRVFWEFFTLLPLGLFGMGLSSRLVWQEKTEFDKIAVLYFSSMFLILYLLIQRMGVFLVFFFSIMVGDLFIVYYKKYKMIIPIAVGVCFIAQIYVISTMEAVTVEPDVGSRKEIVTWIRNKTNPNDIILTGFALGPTINSYAGRPIVLHPKFENFEIRNRVKNFVYTLFQTEGAFYNFCQKHKAKYFIYEKEFFIREDKESLRYMSNNVKVKQSSAVYKFQFKEKEKDLTYFFLVHENSDYKIFRITDNPTISQLYRLGIEFLRNREHLKAIQKFQDTLRIEPLHIGARYLMANTYKLGRQYEEAIGEYKKVLQQMSNHIDAHLELGEIYSTLHKYDKAMVELKEVLRLDPKNTCAYNNLGNVYYEKGIYRTALQLYHTVLKLDPLNYAVYKNLGLCYSKAPENYEKAISCYKKYLELNSSAGQKRIIERDIAEMERHIALQKSQGQNY